MSNTTTTISPYWPFDTIPNEVLLRIVSSSLPRSTLLSLTRVSARFREAATIALYEYIDIEWSYSLAAQLAETFDARPQLYSMVRTVAVQFSDPKSLEHIVRHAYEQALEKMWDLNEELQEKWEKRIASEKESKNWEEEYSEYLEWDMHAGQEPTTLEEYFEDTILHLWFDFLYEDEVIDALARQYVAVPKHSWLSEEGDTQGKEAFATFVMKMNNLSGLHINQVAYDHGGTVDFGAQTPAFTAFSKQLRPGRGAPAALLDLVNGGELRQLSIDATTPLPESPLSFPRLERLRILDCGMDFNGVRVADLTRLLRSARTIRSLSIDAPSLHRVLELSPSFRFNNLQHLALGKVGYGRLPDAAWTPGSPLGRLVSSSNVTTLEFEATLLKSPTKLLDAVPLNIQTLSIHIGQSSVDEMVRRVLDRLEGSEPESRFLSCVKVIVVRRMHDKPLETKAFDGKGRVFVERDEGKTWEERQRWWEF
ncbi:hypothetical protein MNV49_007527 [Pseudohyphozyma bogoriensis]|nr:hypothetical protein MNV49_007527 [Pseudohyphozyma bogoriensis]